MVTQGEDHRLTDAQRGNADVEVANKVTPAARKADGNADRPERTLGTGAGDEDRDLVTIGSGTMSGSVNAPRKLGELEHLVMEFIWSQGPATAEQVRESLASRHPMKESTTRTVLRRLEAKGYLTHRVDGRTHIYSGAERPQNVAARAVRQIVERFCSGSVEQLLVGMVNNDVIGEQELERLARKIARRKGKTQED